MKNKLAINTITSLAYQIIAIICSFILPRLIIISYGTELNGLVNSINQFLSVITFLELGVGAVIQSALYKPLAEKNNDLISKIMVSGTKFFNHIALILVAYIGILVIIYPIVVNKNYEWLFTATLIISMSISLFAQYYFGVVDRLLLTADQMGYIQYIAQIITLVLNTLICVILIRWKVSIHVVKLTTSMIYVLRPVFLRLYVIKHYNINRKAKYSVEPIAQKWNGMAQHISAVVLTGTDTIILTIFSSLQNVSIYSVYYMVISGLKVMFTSLNSGFHALIGKLWAKKDITNLNYVFGIMEWFIHTCVVFVFGCTFVLLIPFVQVYTVGIKDANYLQNNFSIIITLAYAINALSIPYHAMILVAGNYKQTQTKFIFTAIINIVISILAVYYLNLIGVAIGTLVAMIYQFIWMTLYVSKNINYWPLKNVIKQLVIDIISIIIGVVLASIFHLNNETYLSWIVLAIKVVIVFGMIIVLINSILCKNKVKLFIKYITNKQLG